MAVPDARPLFLALALEAAPLGVVRLARPAWRRSAYVTTLAVDPDSTENPWAVPTWADARNSSADFYPRGN